MDLPICKHLSFELNAFKHLEFLDWENIISVLFFHAQQSILSTASEEFSTLFLREWHKSNISMWHGYVASCGRKISFNFLNLWIYERCWRDFNKKEFPPLILCNEAFNIVWIFLEIISFDTRNVCSKIFLPIDIPQIEI